MTNSNISLKIQEPQREEQRTVVTGETPHHCFTHQIGSLQNMHIYSIYLMTRLRHNYQYLNNRMNLIGIILNSIMPHTTL